MVSNPRASKHTLHDFFHRNLFSRMAKQLMFTTGLLLLVLSADAFKFMSKLFPDEDGVITEDHTHCYDKKDSCTKAVWAKLTCDQRYSQWAYCAKMTSYRRRCNVITSHRREYDIILHHVPAGNDCSLWSVLFVSC